MEMHCILGYVSTRRLDCHGEKNDNFFQEAGRWNNFLPCGWKKELSLIKDISEGWMEFDFFILGGR